MRDQNAAKDYRDQMQAYDQKKTETGAFYKAIMPGWVAALIIFIAFELLCNYHSGRNQLQQSSVSGSAVGSTSHAGSLAQSQQKGTTSSEQGSQFESCNYPLIKWKPKLVGSMSGAFAQLTTKYFDSTDNRGYIRYRLTLFKTSRWPNSIIVQLLDEDGFKLDEFTISGYKFHPIAGTSIIEARDTEQLDETNYKLARDYSVNLGAE